MSYAILRVAKHQSGAVGGIERHNERKLSKFRKNQDIDKEKSSLNYYLHDSQKSYQKRIAEILQSEYKSDRKIRTDAVVACEILITSDKNFFDSLSESKREKFFEIAHEFLTEKFGKNNVISSVVHLDEKTPHMHFLFVPLTNDGKLSAKQLFTPLTLKKLQNEFYAVVKRNRFNLERGIESDRKHIKIGDYKKQTALEIENKLKEKENYIEKIDEIIEQKKQRIIEFDEILREDLRIEDIKKEVKSSIFSSKKSVVIEAGEFEKVQNHLMAFNFLQEEKKKIDKKNEALKIEIEIKNQEIIKKNEEILYLEKVKEQFRRERNSFEKELKEKSFIISMFENFLDKFGFIDKFKDFYKNFLEERSKRSRERDLER